MRPGGIQAVDHVRREVPPNIDAQLRWFYVEVGGLEAVASEGEEEIRFRSARLHLRLVKREVPQIEPAGFPVVIAVDSLSDTADALREASWPCEKLTGTNWADACLATNDPAGNRVSLRQEWPFGIL